MPQLQKANIQAQSLDTHEDAPRSAGPASRRTDRHTARRLWPSIPRWWLVHPIVALVLFGIVYGAFWNSWQSGMVLDNKYIIEEYYKALLRADPKHDLQSWRQIGLIFQNDYWWPKGISGLYRPITTFTYWIDYVLLTGKPLLKTDADGKPILRPDGVPEEVRHAEDVSPPNKTREMTWNEYVFTPFRRLDTSSYHWINLLLHWATALLVYFTSLMLLQRIWPAAFVAALFAVHPITTESVTNIIGRADIFAAITVFGGILLYARSKLHDDSWQLPWLVGLMLLVGFGLFAKESAAAVAIVLIVYDITYRWRKNAGSPDGLPWLILHGVLYLAAFAILLGIPALSAWRFSSDAPMDWMPLWQQITMGCIVCGIGAAQYLFFLLKGSGRDARQTSLVLVAMAAVLASLFIHWYGLILGGAVAIAEFSIGRMTSGSLRWRVAGHSVLYLALFMVLVALPFGALIWFHWLGLDDAVPPGSGIGEGMPAWWRFGLGACAFLAGLFIHVFTIRSARPVRIVALLTVAFASIVCSFLNDWMGGLLAIIVGTHELLLATLLARDEQYRRDWKAIWHHFAIGYVMLIPPLLAMLFVRMWVFAYSSPPETPFLDNPIRGIWQVRELGLKSFEDELLRKPMYGYTWVECKMTAVKIMGRLLLLLSWPQTLSADYSYAQIPNFSWHLSRWADWQAVIALAAMAGIGIGAAYAYRRNRAVFFFILFFFAAALPTSNFWITIGSVMAERFMYLPLAGFVGVLVIGAFWLARKIWDWLKLYDADDFPWYNTAAGLFLAVVVMVYGVRAFIRNFAWESDLTLWTAAAADSPWSFRSYQSLAFAMYEQYCEIMAKPGADAPETKARLDALVQNMIDTAERARPIVDPLPNHLNSSRLYLHLGMYYAIKADRLSVRGPDGAPALTPDARACLEKSVEALERGSQVDRAFNEVNKAKLRLRGDPPDEISDAGLGPVYSTLGVSYLRLGLLDKALNAFQYQRQLEPGEADAYSKLANVYLQQRKFDEAAVALIQTVLLDVNRRDAWQTLAQLYAQVFSAPDALVQQGGSIKLNIGHPIVKNHLCSAYRDFIRVFRRAHRNAMADEASRAAVQRYNFPRSLFDPLFHEPIPIVTPQGLIYRQ